MANAILCPHCGLMFAPAHPFTMYCSLACSRAVRRVKPHTCITCGILFTPIKIRHSDQGLSAYTGRKNCSRECDAIDRGARTSARMRADRDKWIGPNNPMWKGSCLRRNKSYRGPDWTLIAEKIRKRDQEACRHCGMSQAAHTLRWRQLLEVHHVVPFSEFTDQDKANRRSNLITLCKTCHMRADRAIKQRQLLLTLYDEPRKKSRDGISRGSRNARAQLSEEQVVEIKRRIRAKERFPSIAAAFSVKPTVISAISTGQNWKHVPWPA